MRVVAILETMWDWRGMTSGAGYQEAPRYFRINPENHSGRRLYKLCGSDAQLLVTNACRELATIANGHGKPDPVWLKENLTLIEHGPRGASIEVLLVCGKVAQQCFRDSGYEFKGRVVEMPHPAARMWTVAMVQQFSALIQSPKAEAVTA